MEQCEKQLTLAYQRDYTVDQEEKLSLQEANRSDDRAAVAVSELPGYPGRRHALGLWVEKNPAPPPNRRALDCLTVGELCPIVSQNNIVVSNKHD